MRCTQRWGARFRRSVRGESRERWTPMSTLKQLQRDVALRMRRGDSFAAVEEELIDPCPLSEAEKAALWLYGWSFVNWRRQRREATAHLDRLESAAALGTGERIGRMSLRLPARAH